MKKKNKNLNITCLEKYKPQMNKIGEKTGTVLKLYKELRKVGEIEEKNLA